jgi:multidrug efflux pump subunit AcrA (membrane-fusion protein)
MIVTNPPTSPAPPQRKRSHKMLWFAPLFLVVVLAAFLGGYLPRRRAKEQLDAAAAKRKSALPLASAAKVRRAERTSKLLLPGNVTPLTEAYIFARASGYLKSRYVDIGDRVRADQLLAEIDAPDLDQQVSQARAALAQSESQLGQSQATLAQLIATRDLAKITWERYKVLTATGAVSRQEGDNWYTNYKTAEANVLAGEKAVVAAAEFVRTNQANLERLIVLQGYKSVTAPFAGIITARNVDVGALISATGEVLGPTRPFPSAPTDIPGTGQMFRVAKIDRLRVLVSVPQTYWPTIRVGQAVTLNVQELPNVNFPGKVTRTSSSLDAASRTLLTEVQVANPKGILLPGMYSLLQFIAERKDPPFLVPDAALVVRPAGTFLAVLVPLNAQERQKAAKRTGSADTSAFRRAHFVSVQPGRDFGTELEILRGLQGGEEVAVSPSDSVQEGVLVQATAFAEPKQASSGKPEGR